MQPAEPTPKQMRALEGLLLDLMRRYDLTVDDVYCHRDFRQTSCPGDRFPFDDLVRNLRGAAPPAPAARRVDTGQEP
jgi:N-acetyl-anhydromuramyl-L-alanine amidase AmpD